MGKVKAAKVGFGRRVIDYFMPGDFMTVKDDLVKEVFLPSLKDTLVEMVTDIIHGVAYGNEAPARYKFSSGRFANSVGNNVRKNVNKNRFVQTSIDGGTTLRRNEKLDYRNVKVQSRRNAEEIIKYLEDIIKNSEYATVGDLYELLEWDQTPFVEKWGWYDLSNCRIKNIREDGEMWYLIIFPQPVDVRG